MPKQQKFHKISFWIIACFSIWWVLWFYLTAFISDLGADPFRSVLSLTALQTRRQQLGLIDGNVIQSINRPADETERHTVLNSTLHEQLESGFLAGSKYFRTEKSAKVTGPDGEGKEDCNGRYVYMYTLPPKFNTKLVKECRTLSVWTNMCPHVANSGLGQPLFMGFDPETSPWFATNQFTAELIFHERMKRYTCLTTDPFKAAAFYVPFYAGFEMSRGVGNQNFTARDRTGIQLVQFLRKTAQWKKMWGRDHFMVMGRITWDFLREDDSPGAWGNRLLLLPEVKNMSALLIEAHPWHENEHGIPYPSYFHPRNKQQLVNWQYRMRSERRQILFSFAGGPRPGLDKASIRAHILEQCSASARCQLLKCEQGGPSVCHDPKHVMKLFSNSVFCLQPQGDSFTRRSIFDSMLAGCIPVFFNRHSAYTQYKWHLPHNPASYSVFIPEESVQGGNVSIEKLLMSVKAGQVESMRKEVIALIPSIVYADPRHTDVDYTDAFHVAIRGIVDKIAHEKVRYKLSTSKKGRVHKRIISRRKSGAI